ncbi:hypothetical protein ACFUNF_24745 [Streptomyces sp. NPDC057291]|uniref:hypothetical protein n=1 Tax=Streptomyces sp. NPDC057291 TaxID=3346087 RepID=UPI003626DBF9
MAHADADVVRGGPAFAAPQTELTVAPSAAPPPPVIWPSTWAGERAPRRAVLELHGSSTDGAPLTFMVYAMTDTTWADGRELTWDSGPYDAEQVRPTSVGTTLFPAGQLSVLGDAASARLDVTDALDVARGRTIGFLLIREPQRAQDTADNGRRATVAGLAAAEAAVRPRLLLTD